MRDEPTIKRDWFFLHNSPSCPQVGTEDYVGCVDCDPKERQRGVREKAIRDCIKAVEDIDDVQDEDTRYILGNVSAALHALLEKS